MSTATPDRGGPLRRFLGAPFSPQTYSNLAYLALAFPLGMAYFIGITIGLTFGGALVIVWVGVPILLGTIAAATVIAGFEAALARRLVGTDAPAPASLRGFDPADIPRPGNGVIAAVVRFLLRPTTWTSLLLVLVKFVFGVVAFSALVAVGATVASALGAPLLYNQPGVTYQFGGYTVSTLETALAVSGVGVVGAFVGLHLLNWLAETGAAVTAALLDVADERSGPDGTTENREPADVDGTDDESA
ncbi:sensor domain-containing protein [Halostella salina]|uniref:sensor domain-containing protein n=1 Tax=Halostella salina TaxID=1547897 RepID=UPI000EF8425E|nr:sensor domain-containing protein [Halostella salina]